MTQPARKQPPHALENALESCIRLLETTLQPATITQYRHTVRLFIEFLKESFAETRQPSQLRRDPLVQELKAHYMLGWLEYRRKSGATGGAGLNNL